MLQCLAVAWNHRWGLGFPKLMRPGSPRGAPVYLGPPLPLLTLSPMPQRGVAAGHVRRRNIILASASV